MNAKTYPAYTLIELLIYASLVTVIVGAFLTGSYYLITSSQHDRERLALLENERFIIHRLEQLLYGATPSQITPISGTAPALTVQRSCTDLVRIEQVNDAVVVWRNTNGDCSITAADQNYTLTNSHVVASSLSFEHQLINNQSAIRFQAVFTNQNMIRNLDKSYYIK